MLQISNLFEIAERKRFRKCGEAKTLDAFRLVRGLASSPCKGCRSAADRMRRESDDVRAKSRGQLRAWKAANPDRVREAKIGELRKRAERADKIYTEGAKPWEAREINRHAALIAQGMTLEQARRERDESRRADKQRKAEQRAADKAARIAAQPWTDTALSDAEAYRIRYRLDPAFVLKERIRASMTRKLGGPGLAKLMRAQIRRAGRSRKVEALLGYSIDDLTRHLERQFHRRMTWAAFMRGAIHIDHIVPLSSFDISDLDQLKAAWALTNLRPLWQRDNLAKHSTRTHLL